MFVETADHLAIGTALPEDREHRADDGRIDVNGLFNPGYGRIEGSLMPSGGTPHPDHLSPEALADTVLSAIRVRVPNGQVHLVEMSFGDLADRDAALELDLTWDATAEVNVFSIRQGERAIATARIGLVGREPLSRDWAAFAR